MKIGERIVGQDAAPFVIAEVSGNHNQSLDRALAIVDAAAAAGAHGLKLQTYTPDSMTLDLNEREFRVDDPGSLWFGRSLYELYGEACTPYEWHEPIFERARRHGLIPFSTPFDAASVEFLESLDVSCYKIASFEIQTSHLFGRRPLRVSHLSFQRVWLPFLNWTRLFTPRARRAAKNWSC